MTNKQRVVLSEIIAALIIIAAVTYLSLWFFGPLTIDSKQALPLASKIMLSMGIWVIIFILIRARQRFFNVNEINGEPPEKGSSSDLQGRILKNTVEQLIIAIPLLFTLTVLAIPGNGMFLILLGCFFSAGRVLFWIGYNHAPALRGLGFSLTFYPTVLLYIYVIIRIFS